MSTASAPDAAKTPAPDRRPGGALRHGWTTGTCATAAAKAAFVALATGDFPDPVAVSLPGGQTPAFALAQQGLGTGEAWAAVVKDAGDDPDVTHGAVVKATVRPAPPGSGIVFRAGEGVGTITKPGLPLPPGEPAINPGPRAMIGTNLEEAAAATGHPADVVVEIAIEDGARLAEKTLNGRLGIVGGLSVLGTTGIVVPFSCSAWIHSIHRGIDVARAEGLTHVAGATGNASEKAVAAHHGLPDAALIDMGDFVGGMLKYLRRHPVRRVTVAGGVAKMTKLAQGFLDLHSRRGSADMGALAETARACGAADDLAARIATANTVAEAFDLARAAHIDLGGAIASAARATAARVVAGAPIAVEVLVFDRQGGLVGMAPFGHSALPDAADGRNRRS
ncbi:MAG: cobalt-precorrin-5B (C(1))-methyltransferase [Rhodospirillaceae bacterium]|nr:cobalt-precorrin-5B (C(1))-methyltransferase [Rhodospirillaceae bacterium]